MPAVDMDKDNPEAPAVKNPDEKSQKPEENITSPRTNVEAGAQPPATARPGKGLTVGILFNLMPDFNREDINSVVRAVERIESVLLNQGYQAQRFQAHEGLLPFLHQLEASQPDVVLNLCEGYRDKTEGEVYIAGILEMLNIPYTGSTPFTLALALDKVRAKEIFIARRIPTPAYAVYDQYREEIPPLSFPLILKLSREDASVGMTNKNVVYDEDSFFLRLKKLLKEYSQPILVEEFIDGREFNVAFLNDEPLPIEEILFSIEPKLLCYKAKWEEGSVEDRGTIPVCPPRLSARERRKILKLAYDAYSAIGVRDYGRVDLRMDADGKLYVLEVNPNPDITSEGGFVQCLKAADIPYETFILMLVDFALSRGKTKKSYRKTASQPGTVPSTPDTLS